jgi:hypothetical protein
MLLVVLCRLDPLTTEKENDMKKIVAVTVGVILLMALAGFAQATKEKAAAHQANGTISSVEGNAIVLDHKVKGKDEKTTFVMNASTRKAGDLVVGAKATVHYMTENGQNVATMVQATAAAKKK